MLYVHIEFRFIARLWNIIPTNTKRIVLPYKRLNLSVCPKLHLLKYGAVGLDTLRPRRSVHNFAVGMFNSSLNCCIFIKIEQAFVPNGPVNNMPALAQLIAGRSRDKSIIWTKHGPNYRRINASLGISELNKVMFISWPRRKDSSCYHFLCVKVFGHSYREPAFTHRLIYHRNQRNSAKHFVHNES